MRQFGSPTNFRVDAQTLLALHLAVALGLTSIVIESDFRWIVLGLFAALSLGRVGRSATGLRPRLDSPLRFLGIGLAALAFTIIALLFARQVRAHPLEIVRFGLIIGAFVFLFTRCRNIKDLWQITILIFSFFFFSAVLIRPPSFLPCFALALFCTLYAFYHASRDRWRLRQINHASLRFTLAQFVLTMALGILVFIAFPRSWFATDSRSLRSLPSLYDEHSEDDSLLETGVNPFRQSLQLTNLHELVISDKPVLTLSLFTVDRLRTRLTAEGPIYLRGRIYTHYDKGHWAPDEETRLIRRNPGDDEIVLRRINRNFGDFVEQEIHMAPHGDLCFAMPEPVQITGPSIRFSDAGVIRFPKTRRSMVRYKVFSRITTQRMLRRLRRAPVSPPPRNVPQYLETPTDLLNSRILSPISLPDDLNAWEKAERIKNYLTKNYAYSLEPFTPTDQMDPVRYFLSSKKQGYCVHFASAMTLMARAANLPARLASGYRYEGPVRKAGDYLLRDYNAHAWTEILFPGYGWVIFDATPTIARDDLNSKSDSDGLSTPTLIKLLDLNFLIHEFDQTTQSDALRHAVDWFKKLGLRLWAAARSGVFLISAASLICLTLLGMWLTPSRYLRRLHRYLRRTKPTASIDFYQDFLWLMLQFGVRKKPEMTGLEFATYASSLVDTTDIHWITHCFYEVKFAGKPLSNEQQRAMGRALARLGQLMRRKKPKVMAPGD